MLREIISWRIKRGTGRKSPTWGYPPSRITLFFQIQPINRQKAPFFALFLPENLLRHSCLSSSSFPFSSSSASPCTKPLKNAQNMQLNALFPFLLFTALYSLFTSFCTSLHCSSLFPSTPRVLRNFFWIGRECWRELSCRSVVLMYNTIQMIRSIL